MGMGFSRFVFRAGFHKSAVVLLAAWTLGGPALARDQQLPNCQGAQEVDNERVQGWVESAENGFQSRGHIFGKIVEVYDDRTGHKHFAVQIGEVRDDAVEVIYNEEFGDLPELEIGMEVEACGDFIQSNEDTRRYRASPEDAILHWVHRSTGNHPSGYVAIDGVLYGQGNGRRNGRGH